MVSDAVLDVRPTLSGDWAGLTGACDSLSTIGLVVLRRPAGIRGKSRKQKFMEGGAGVLQGVSGT